MTDGTRRLGFGITSRPRAGVERLARRVEELGYDELWTNDTRAGSGLETLAQAAAGSSTIGLGIGVIGLSEKDSAGIVDEVRRLELPLERVILGIGSGASSSVELVRDGAVALRRALPSTRLAIAAVGPRMLRLAGELADVVLLNWNVPERVAWSRDRVKEGADAAGRAVPTVAAYVRVAIGDEATQRLEREAERYRGSTPAYRRAFEAQEIDLGAIGIAAPTAREVAGALEPYRQVLDTTIARGLPARDDVDTWLEIAEAAAPRAA